LQLEAARNAEKQEEQKPQSSSSSIPHGRIKKRKKAKTSQLRAVKKEVQSVSEHSEPEVELQAPKRKRPIVIDNDDHQAELEARLHKYKDKIKAERQRHEEIVFALQEKNSKLLEEKLELVGQVGMLQGELKGANQLLDVYKEFLKK
jgi:hypothetical protein